MKHPWCDNPFHDQFGDECGVCKKYSNKDYYFKLLDKVKVYEGLFHKINLYLLVGKDLTEILMAIDRWSYAHRFGNGMLTQEEQQEVIDKVFEQIRNLVEGE